MNRAPRFTPAALACIEATGADWRSDLAELISGETTEAALLEHCLDGVEEPAVERGWHDYVGELCRCIEPDPFTPPPGAQQWLAACIMATIRREQQPLRTQDTSERAYTLVGSLESHAAFTDAQRGQLNHWLWPTMYDAQGRRSDDPSHGS